MGTSKHCHIRKGRKLSQWQVLGGPTALGQNNIKLRKKKNVYNQHLTSLVAHAVAVTAFEIRYPVLITSVTVNPADSDKEIR